MTRLPAADLDHVLDHTRALWDDVRGESLFLTGGSGFVGSWLLESLLWAHDRLDLGITVVALTRNAGVFRARMPHLAGHATVRVLEGNAIDFAFPAGAFPFVVHAATERAFEPDAQHPLGTFDADVAATRRVLELASSRATRRFLFTSSGAVYGNQPPDMTHIPEDYAGAPSTMDAGSAYGQAKRVSEFMCAMYGRVHGFSAVIARLFAFVGPRLPLDANYAVGNFIGDTLRGGPIRIAGNGTPYRSYLYAADLAIWLWTLLLRGQSGRPYNVGSARALTIAELAGAVAQVAGLGIRIEIARKPVPTVPALHYVPDTLRAQSELGLRSVISLEEGIDRTMQTHSSSDPAKPAKLFESESL